MLLSVTHEALLSVASPWTCSVSQLSVFAGEWPELDKPLSFFYYDDADWTVHHLSA